MRGNVISERTKGASVSMGTDEPMKPSQATPVIDRVAEMYERHPYPPVDEDIEAYARGEAWLLESPNPSFHLYWPFEPPRLDLDILIAGCGTQQAAQVAAGLPEARIVATDISDNSLAETKRLLARIGRDNVELHRLPIEETGSLERDFDLIICTGVLHHLEDPQAGLGALARALRPSGSMHLMLYGRHGRAGVYMMQQLFRAMGIDPLKVTTRDLKELRKLVEGLPETHPFGAVRHLHPDWQDDEGFVDLLLHVQDRAYGLDEVADFLGTADLKIQKLMFAGRTDPMFAPVGDFGGKVFEKLPELQQRTAVEIYRASVKKHVFVACHNDRDPATYVISPARDTWDTTIPVVTYGIEVLRPTATRDSYHISWPYHGSDEIVVDASENAIRLLEAIDGKRTISDVVRAAGFKPGDKSLMRHLEDFLKSSARADFLTFRAKTT